MHFEDPYEILGLKAGASSEEVREAYEKLAEDEEKKDRAKAAFEQILETEKEEQPEETSEEKPEEKPDAEQAEEKPENSDEKTEQKKGATPAQIALGVAAVILLVAVLVALILAAMGGSGDETVVPAETAPAATAEAVPGETAPETTEATIPADGDPNNETCKGSYTGTDEEVIAAADTVVASMDDYHLTNAQLQVYYWMGIQSYVQSAGPYLQFMGLDVSRPLDSQVCPLAEGQSWQQFFLQQALQSWQNYQAMAAEADASGRELEEDLLEALKTLPADMEEEAKANGFEDAAALLRNNVGAGAAIEDYVNFMEVYHRGYGYFVDTLDAATPDDARLEAYFAEHEAELKEGGINKDNRVCTARHILISPEDTASDESWQKAEARAKEILDQYLAGDKTSESFAKLASEHTMDPGSKSTGGLYEDFAQGQMVPEFDQWCFDASRVNGDTDIVKTEFGYHIMYYVSSRPVWKDQVSQVIMKETADKLIQDTAAKYPMDIDYSSILLGELKAQ